MYINAVITSSRRCSGRYAITFTPRPNYFDSRQKWWRNNGSSVW